MPRQASAGNWIFWLGSAISSQWRRCRFAALWALSTSASAIGGRQCYAFLLWGVALGAESGAEVRRERQADAVRAARAAVHRRDGDLPDHFRPLHRLHRLEPERAVRPSFQRPRQSAHALGRRLLLERARQHGLLRRGRDRAIRDRLRPRAAAERRHPRAQVLPRGLPPALHAEPGRGELDDRQVD